MRILNYCAGYDTGGYSIRLKQAFDEHSKIEYRSCIGRPSNYIRYPTDQPAVRFKQLVDWADMIHVSHQPVPGVRKPQVVQYHGTKFRNNPAKFLALQKAAGAVGVCSTVDLCLLDGGLRWLPSPYNLDWLATFRKPVDDGVLRVGHSPTNRVVKSTAHLIAAVAKLNKETPTRLVLTEKQPWRVCLERKGVADVYFDQVILGYGNNAVEAWGMGIPVIAGAQPETIREMRHRFGILPFYEATEETIYDALVAMTDPNTRILWAEAGRRHAAVWHSAEKVVALLETIYKTEGEAVGTE